MSPVTRGTQSVQNLDLLQNTLTHLQNLKDDTLHLLLNTQALHLHLHLHLHQLRDILLKRLQNTQALLLHLHLHLHLHLYQLKNT